MDQLQAAQIMKCTVCHSDQVIRSKVQEELPIGADIVLVPIEVPVCQSCGERYYDRQTLRKLEQLEDDLAARRCAVREVGKVLELAQ